MEEWMKGSNFTCKSTHENSEDEQTTSICKMYASSPPSIHLEIPSFKTVMTSTSTVKARCVIGTVFDAEVTWRMNGRVAQSDAFSQSRSGASIISEVTVLSSQWEQLKLVTCGVQHACFSYVEKTKNFTEPGVAAPVVMISRSLPDLLKGDSAVFKCDITQLSSSDLYVTLQANGVGISDNRFVDVRNALDIHSITEHFNVPDDYWRRDHNFTCKVNQGFFTSSTSQSMGGIFADPLVELLLIPSEDSETQTLMCSGSSFDPEIKWFPEAKTRSSSTKSTITMGADGRVAVTSRLSVPREEWQNGTVFTCEVSDKSLKTNVNGTISVRSVTPARPQFAEVYVQASTLQPLLNKDKSTITITCLLVGHHLSDFSIIWKVDDGEFSGQNGRTTRHINGTETVQSFFNVSAEDWHAHKKVSCEGKHRRSNKGYVAHVSKSRDLRPPTVKIIPPTASEIPLSDTFTLVCEVSGFFPSNIIVSWERNGEKVPSSCYINGPVWNHSWSSSFFMSSRLNVSKSLDRPTYSCVAVHESSEAPFRRIIEDDWSSVAPSEPSVLLLQGSKELVCLAFGFAPEAINITWLRNGTLELRDYSTSELQRGADGKFSIRSHLRLSLVDSLPGVTLTCKVTHSNSTKLHLSQPDTLDQCDFLDLLIHEEVSQDTGVETLHMAFIFLSLFLLSLTYGVSATMFKTK